MIGDLYQYGNEMFEHPFPVIFDGALEQFENERLWGGITVAQQSTLDGTAQTFHNLLGNF